MNKVLFLSYDGILEPLGYSQILSYLLHLSKINKIYIISFEKESDLKNKKHYQHIIKLMNDNNIIWKYFTYKKNYLKYINVIFVFFYLIYFIKLNNISIIHARSYIPAILAYFIKKILKIKYIFDMRGFWLDERIEWNIWSKKSLTYIFFKYYEKKIICKSNAIVTLTNVSSELIKEKYNLNKSKNIFQSIPTCVNLNNNQKIPVFKNNSKINLTHLGAIGTRYNFINYLKLGKKIQNKRNVFFSIFNKDEHEFINYALKEYKIDENDYKLQYVLPYNIDQHLKKVNLGVFFPIKGYYLNGYFPTKLGEFLSNGIPIITCKINRDVDSLIMENNIGLVIDDFDNYTYDDLNIELIEKLISNETSLRCIKLAEKYFDIKTAAAKYNKIYNQI